MRLARCVGDRVELKIKAMGSHGGFVSRGMCLRTASEPDSSVTGEGKWPGRAGPGGPDDYFNRKKSR